MTVSKRAFTLVELAVVLAIVAVLGTMVLPALASVRGNSQRFACVNNLKQIGVAFSVWEGNHGRRYPMSVPASVGGASQYLYHSTGSTTGFLAGGPSCPGMVYMVMSNELANSKILFCPSDNLHSAAATNFGWYTLLGISGSSPANMNGQYDGISYFVNADVTEINPQDVMAGDDNIGNQTTSLSSPSNYRFGASATTEMLGSVNAPEQGITSVAWSASSGNWAWTANDFHQKAGNISFTDGSCQMVDISGLHKALSSSTNSAMAEVFNFMP